MRVFGIGAVAVGLLVLVSACSTASNDTSSRESAGAADAKSVDVLPDATDLRSLFGARTWKLVGVVDTTQPIPARTRDPLTLQLVSTESGLQWQGNGGCNGFSMAVVENGSDLKPGVIRASKMACEHLGFETAYFATLAKVSGVRRQGSELHLLVAGAPMLRYAPVD